METHRHAAAALLWALCAGTALAADPARVARENMIDGNRPGMPEHARRP